MRAAQTCLNIDHLPVNPYVEPTYSSLEKAKYHAAEYALGKEDSRKWEIIENQIDADPTNYSNIVFENDSLNN